MDERAARLAGLHGAAFPEGQRWTAEAIAGLLGQAGVFIVERPGGFAMGRVAADEVELLTLAVDPERQRAGIGRSCLAGFEAEAIARGAIQAFLDVSEGNEAARALYLGAGYAEVGRRRGYYAGGVDAMLMRKGLVA